MEMTKDTVQTVWEVTERNPLTHIIATLTECTANQKDILFMAQPEENAVYVHAADAEQFAFVVDSIAVAVHEINHTLETIGHSGRYHAEPDRTRHCLDIFYNKL